MTAAGWHSRMNALAEHRLRNDLSETRQIEAWVGKFAQQASLPPKVQNALDLALVEWMANIISYAFPDAREHWITVRFRADDQEVRVEVEDDGREFNPLNLPPVDTTAPLETRPIGGLGIHMICKLMDTVLHRREGGRNILTLVKRRA